MKMAIRWWKIIRNGVEIGRKTNFGDAYKFASELELARGKSTGRWGNLEVDDDKRTITIVDPAQ